MDFKKVMGGLSKSGALSGFMGGVAGGGLTSMISSKKGRKTGKSVMKVGALAAVGGLAWKAYQQYSNKQQGMDPQANNNHASQNNTYGANNYQSAPNNIQHNVSHNNTARFDFTPARIEQQAFEQVVDDSNTKGQMLLMRAMIAAAYSDGHIDETERQKIFAQVETMDLSLEEKATLFDELRKPLDLNSLVSQVPDAQTGIEVYAASASALDLSEQHSQQYLNMLASQLCIPSELTHSILDQISQH